MIPETACAPGAPCGGHHVGHRGHPRLSWASCRPPLPCALPCGQPWVAGTILLGPSLHTPTADPPLSSLLLPQFEEPCHVNSSRLLVCRTPALPSLPDDPWVRVEFVLDNLVFDFATLNPAPFSYEVNPTLQPLNPEDPTAPFRHKPGSVLSVEVRRPLGRGETRDPSLCWAVLLGAVSGSRGRGMDLAPHLLGGGWRRGAWVLTLHGRHLSDKM